MHPDVVATLYGLRKNERDKTEWLHQVYFELIKKGFDSDKAYFIAYKLYDNMTVLECVDCEYIFSKDITGRTVEVMCPKCKSYDIEIRSNLKTLRNKK